MSAERSTDLIALVERCRAGIEAELVLLVRLQDLAARQREATVAADIDALRRAADERDGLTSELMALDGRLRPEFERLAVEPAAAGVAGFGHATSLRRTVAQMVQEILEADRGSIRSLEEIVAARRSAVQDAEHAEATLAAYGRRVAAPKPTPSLFNRRG